MLGATDPPHALPFDGSDTTGFVDARLPVPGHPTAKVKIYETIDMAAGDDPRVAYSYRLVVRGRQVLGWDRDPDYLDHRHIWAPDGSTVGHPPETIGRAQFLSRVIDYLSETQGAPQPPT